MGQSHSYSTWKGWHHVMVTRAACGGHVMKMLKIT